MISLIPSQNYIYISLAAALQCLPNPSFSKLVLSGVGTSVASGAIGCSTPPTAPSTAYSQVSGSQGSGSNACCGQNFIGT